MFPHGSLSSMWTELVVLFHRTTPVLVFTEKHLGKDDPDARMAGLEMPQPLPGNDEEIKASMVFQEYEEGFGKLSGVTEMW